MLHHGVDSPVVKHKAIMDSPIRHRPEAIADCPRPPPPEEQAMADRQDRAEASADRAEASAISEAGSHRGEREREMRHGARS
eukprot:12432765-Alexandrium_andersonii.AAC.1